MTATETAVNMYALQVVRQGLVDALAGSDVNAYAYPDPQVEYPAVVVPTFNGVGFHQSIGCDGILIGTAIEVMVAKGETESAVKALEQLALYVAGLLEADPPGDPPPWARLVVHRLENMRTREGAGAMSGDLIVEIHA